MVRLELQEDVPFDPGDDIDDLFVEPLLITLGKPGLVRGGGAEEESENKESGCGER
jgi:hypothetical protein